MKKWLWLVAVVVLGLAIFLYVELRSQQQAREGPPGGSAIIEGWPVDVVSGLQGRIETIAVGEGESVESNQVVVRLECDQQRARLSASRAQVAAGQAALDGAETGVKVARQSVKPIDERTAAARSEAEAADARRRAAKAQWEAARRELARIETLERGGVATGQQVDQARDEESAARQHWQAQKAGAEAAYEQASAVGEQTETTTLQVEVAQDQRRQAAAELDTARANLQQAREVVDECSLEAARDAYVQSRNYEPGEMVMPGARILSLVDTDPVRATFYLSNAQLGEARPGRDVRVVPDAYPDSSFTGQIHHVAEQAEFTPRNVQTREARERLVYAVEVTIPNPDRRLRPGMPVEVTIPGAAEED